MKWHSSSTHFNYCTLATCGVSKTASASIKIKGMSLLSNRPSICGVNHCFVLFVRSGSINALPALGRRGAPHLTTYPQRAISAGFWGVRLARILSQLNASGALQTVGDTAINSSCAMTMLRCKAPAISKKDSVAQVDTLYRRTRLSLQSGADYL